MEPSEDFFWHNQLSALCVWTIEVAFINPVVSTIEIAQSIWVGLNDLKAVEGFFATNHTAPLTSSETGEISSSASTDSNYSLYVLAFLLFLAFVWLVGKLSRDAYD